MKALLVSLTAGITLLSGTALSADIIYVAEEQLLGVCTVQADGTHLPFADGLWMVYGLTLDSQGNLYAAGAGDDTIHRVTPTGAISLLASGTILGSPSGLAFDSVGNLLTSGYGWDGTVNRIDTNGIMTRIATGIGGYGLALDVSGNLYISDHTEVIKLATNGVATAFASGFQLAWGLAFDRDGNLFVADYTANTITKVTPGGIASLYLSGLDHPSGLAFDSNGNLYVCNITENQHLGYLNKITPEGAVSVYATGFNYPTAIAIRLEPPVVATNHPPVAQCTNVVVSAGANCVADASVDNGSFDPDGDPITITQSPPGPYPAGRTEVLLTVTDDKGASDSCPATVSVLETNPPVVLSVEARPNVLWPPNHQMVAVNVSALVTDHCGSATWRIIRVQSNEPTVGPGRRNHEPDWIVTGDHTLQLRAERFGEHASRVYSIVIQATDSSGNRSATRTVTVTVPKD